MPINSYVSRHAARAILALLWISTVFPAHAQLHGNGHGPGAPADSAPGFDGRPQIRSPLWFEDKASGCKVGSVHHTNPNEAIKWTGACINGKAGGQGVAAWYVNGHLFETNEGEFHDGVLTGKARILTGRQLFDGEIKGDEFLGKVVWHDGNAFDGEYKAGRPFNGEGRKLAHNVSRETFFPVTYKDGMESVGVTPVSSWPAWMDNHPTRLLNLGLSYLGLAEIKGIEKNPQKALECFRLSAAAGQAQSQINVALMYLRGDAGPSGVPQGIEWLRKATEQEDGNALRILGDLYRQGSKVPPDYSLAMQLLMKASQKEMRSYYPLGLMYWYGQGVPKQPAEAAQWFWKAAHYQEILDSNNSALIKKLFLDSQGTGFKLTLEDDEVERYKKALRSYVALSQVLLAYLYETGQGVPRNQILAYALNYVASKNGNATAEKNLAGLAKKMNATEVANAVEMSTQLFKVAQP